MPPCDTEDCLGGGPVMPPDDGINGRGVGTDGVCSTAPGTAGPTEKPQCGQ